MNLDAAILRTLREFEASAGVNELRACCHPPGAGSVARAAQIREALLRLERRGYIERVADSEPILWLAS